MKKGFIFVETMVVIAFLGTVLLTVYSAFSTVIDNAKTRLYYDDPIYLYRTSYILNFFEENGLPSYIDLKFDNGIVINEISCLSNQLLLMDENGNSVRDFCTKIVDEWNVKHIFIMKYNVNEIVECANKEGLSIKELKECNRNVALRNLSIQGVNFLYSLDGYTGTYNTNYDNNKYRIVIEYGEDNNTKYDYYDYSRNELVQNVNIKTTKYFYSSLEVPYGNLTDGSGVCSDNERSTMASAAEKLKNIYNTYNTHISHIEIRIKNTQAEMGKITAGSGKTIALSPTDVSKYNNNRVIATLVENTVDPSALKTENTYDNMLYNANLYNGTLYIEALNELISCDGEELFSGLTFLQDIKNLRALNTRYMTSMSKMFYDDRNLKALDLSAFDTINVRDMSSMFRSCKTLGSGSNHKLDLSSFDTSNVTSMTYMFAGYGARDPSNPTDKSYSIAMEGLEKIKLGNKFVTNKVTTMSFMFYNNRILKEVNVENFDTSNVTNMSHMFAHNESLKKLDLSEWNTKKVTTFKRMFLMDKNLETIEFGQNFTLDSATIIDGMFASCHALTELDLSSFKNTKTIVIGGRPSAKSAADYVLNPTGDGTIRSTTLWANGLFGWAGDYMTKINMENFDFTLIAPNTDLSPYPLSPEKIHYETWESFIKNKGLIFYRTGIYGPVDPGVEVTVNNCTQKCTLNCYLGNGSYYSGEDQTQTSRIKIIAKEGNATCDCSSHVCRKEYPETT